MQEKHHNKDQSVFSLMLKKNQIEYESCIVPGNGRG